MKVIDWSIFYSKYGKSLIKRYPMFNIILNSCAQDCARREDRSQYDYKTSWEPLQNWLELNLSCKVSWNDDNVYYGFLLTFEDEEWLLFLMSHND